jgi:hypothetical protein
MTNPANGGLVAGAAEWVRDHGGAGAVRWAENLWYTHHAPPKGGRPKRGAIPLPGPSTTSTTAAQGPAIPQLPLPAPIQPIAASPAPGEGQWHADGREVEGIPAVEEAFLRPDPVHTSTVVGVAWMDTKLLSAQLWSGSYIPGGGPWHYTAPVGPQAAISLVAAFNSGFRMKDANGGYYSEGRTVYPLRTGAASFVVYRNGDATVGQWGRDVTMTPDVVAVRQNLDLLVDGGRPVPGLDANDNSKWGYTLGNQVYVWRSGLGVTADGALVYVGGPGMNITTLADVLVRAGAVRAMELDINTAWVNLCTYQPSSPAGEADPANGSTLVQGMSGGTWRYFESWSRDFVTMSARAGLAGGASSNGSAAG